MMKRIGLGQVIFSADQVATLCCVGRNKVIQWIDSGLLPSFRVPTLSKRLTRRVTREALVEFVRKHQMDFVLESLKEPRS